MKEKILDAAAQRILQHGLKKFTIDEIASDLKISKKTVYKYFSSKDEIIRAYFEITTLTDKKSISNALLENCGIPDKIHAIVYSSHKYRLPVSILMEAKLFYPEEWLKIEELKQFKLNATIDLLNQGAEEGIFKSDVHFMVLSKMLENIANIFTDYDFLLDNHLNTREAIDEAIKILFDGILK